jgi:carbon monoxide dehydrogenase subunit G
VRLDHEFTVPAPIGEVWQAVVDPERVAPCMPGATLTKVEGDKFSGTVKVKLGPISLLYKGNGEFLEKDDAAHKVTIKASGKDSRGSGTAAATVTLTLTEAEGGTHGSVATDLSITGKPAQFGRGLISEVGGKILDTFAGCLSGKLAPEPTPAAPAAEPVPEPAVASEPVVKPAPAVKPAPTTAEINTDPKPAAERPPLRSVPAAPETEAIDLLDYAGQSVLKRLAPVLVVIAAVVGLVAIIRALRK